MCVTFFIGVKYMAKINFKTAVPAFFFGVAVTAAAGFGVMTAVTHDPGAFLGFLRDVIVVRHNYFRPIDDKALFEGASKGMVAALGDPYSLYLSGDDYTNFMQSALSEYGGIGVVMTGREGEEPVIVHVFDDSTAKQAGLQEGDAIVSVDGKSTLDLGLNGTADAVRGENGSNVTLSIRREGAVQDFTLTRAQITMPTVQSHMVDGHIGYLHIFSFGKHTADEFGKQLDDLKSQGADKLIIDLRMNPGGMIDSVTAVADKILTAGTVVSYHTKDGHSESYDITGVEQPLPMVVLIDRMSASASEILAGAVQDRKEGTIMGETSYGKGTVQAIVQDNGSTAMKISIAEYRTPAGRSIDKTGITPDVPVKQTGQIFDEATDSVYLKAVEMLEGK